MVRHGFHGFSINGMLWTYCSSPPPPPPLSLSSSSPSFLFLPLLASMDSPWCPFLSVPCLKMFYPRKPCTEWGFVQRAFRLCPSGGGGGTSIIDGGGDVPLDRDDFPVITVDTGYLNRPNWLLAGYSVYHRVASQPTMFMTGPRSRHQRRCVRDATDFFFNECMMIHSRIESPSVPVTVPTNLASTLDREILSPSLSLSQGMHNDSF